MSSAQYLPVTDAERVVWLRNFNAVLPQYATALSLGADVLQTVSDDCRYFSHIIQVQTDLQSCLQAFTQYKNSLRTNPAQSFDLMPTLPVYTDPPPPVPTGIFNRVITLVYMIKRSPAYTTAMGQALGIIASPSTTDIYEVVPKLLVRIKDGQPVLQWNKEGFDGMLVYVDRNDGNGFIQMTRTVKRSCTDTATVPPDAVSANWAYKIKGFIGDEEGGQFSPTISITVFRTS